MKRYIIFLSAYLFAVAFCLQGVEGLDCTNLAPEPHNLSTIKNHIKEYYTSGAWEQALICAVQKAKSILQSYVPVGDKKLAVVFDIDETVLSNWDFYLKMDFGYNHDRHKDWEFSAQAKAIEPIKDLYTFAKDNGFALFFITGRRENQRESTIKNLKKAGFSDWQDVFFKPMDYAGSRTKDFKSGWRNKITQLGYTIVVNIGDQESDLDGEPQALNNFKIPNPVYIIP